ncbi:MAG: sugar ABC transporter permease, partial [Polyangiales bacterium]
MSAHSVEETGGRRSIVGEMLVHLVLVFATVAALYPVLWVVSLALSPGEASGARVLPIPTHPSLDNLRHVVGAHDKSGEWLFGAQLGNSLVVSLSTAIVGVAIATPAAYALARFRFFGRERGMWALTATQMFPGVASLVPLYLILEKLHLLDSRAGLVLVYATTAVPFCVVQLRGAFEA